MNKNEIKYPLYQAVSHAVRSKVYPERVKVFLGGLKASLMLQQRCTDKELERLVFHVFRIGYELGAGEYGGDIDAIHKEMPSFGYDKE